MEADIVSIDGEVADLVTPFETLASAWCEREVKVKPTTPPHSLRRLCVASGLSQEEQDDFVMVIRGIPNFWRTTLNLVPDPGPPAIYASAYERGIFRSDHPGLVVYAAHRVVTVGKPVLQQTIEWLEAHGVHNPVVWITEEE